MNDILFMLWEVYERDGSGCVGYLYKEDAQNCDLFENGYDKISLSNVWVSDEKLKALKERNPIHL